MTTPNTPPVRTRPLAAVALACSIACAAPCQDTPAAHVAAKLRSLIAEKAFNTIPREKAILELRDLGAARELAAFLDQARLRHLVVWALAEIGAPESAAACIDALADADVSTRAHASLDVAAFRTDAVRTWLAALAAEADAAGKPPIVARVRAARIRAGDAAVTRRALDALDGDGDDAARCADALLALGESRRTEHLAAIARLADDGRALATPRPSAFTTKVREDLGGGRVRFKTERATLATIGDVALEAANRALRPTTPEQIAWWHEPERRPRFSLDASGRAAIAAHVAAESAAARAGAGDGRDAARRIFAAIRDDPRWRGDEPLDVRDVALRFVDGWTMRAVIGGKPVEAALGTGGRVTIAE